MLKKMLFDLVVMSAVLLCCGAGCAGAAPDRFEAPIASVVAELKMVPYAGAGVFCTTGNNIDVAIYTEGDDAQAHWEVLGATYISLDGTPYAVTAADLPLHFSAMRGVGKPVSLLVVQSKFHRLAFKVHAWVESQQDGVALLGPELTGNYRIKD